MHIDFEGESLDCKEGESVLDALLRQGHSIPHGCCQGICQACKMLSCDKDFADEASQRGLSESQRKLGQFLSCQCKPKQTIKIRRLNYSDDKIPAVIAQKEWLNKNIIGLRIRAAIRFTPGQYITVWKDEHIARSYSIANANNSQSEIELHIKNLANGKFSNWIAETAEVGSELMLQGPFGSCIYTADTDQPLLLAAAGTGLAPILGIVRDALAQKHSGEIHLVIAAKAIDGFYLLDELSLLAEENPQLTVYCISQSDTEKKIAIKGINFLSEDVYQWCKKTWPALKGWRVFLCGNTSFVGKLRKQCFMNGANMRDISSDIFLPFGQPMS